MRRIIVLESEPRDNGALHLRYALWANVPAARQVFWKGREGSPFTSAVKDGSVTTTEQTNLNNAAVVEQVGESEWPPGTTLAQVQATLVTAATSWQQFVNGYNPWAHYGTFFDDSTNTWTSVTVA